jgi:hypothetical protein
MGVPEPHPCRAARALLRNLQLEFAAIVLYPAFALA